MKLSNKIYQHSKVPLFRSDRVLNERNLEIDLPVLKSKILVSFTLEQAEELIFNKVNFQTELDGVYLGVVDLYIAMLQKRAVEASDRINAKEFDYYCREDKSIPAFEYYNNEFYEVLGIGEKLFKFIFPKESTESVLLSEGSQFFELPFSSQIELIEEALSIKLYQDTKYLNLNLDIEDIKDKTIFISNVPDNRGDLQRDLESNLKKYIFGENEFKLILR